MKTQIRARALELGFDDCRFTTAEPPASAPHFQDWLAQKRHGEMAWLDRNAGKRVNPREVLAGAKSIITLAVAYDFGRANPDIVSFGSDFRSPRPTTKEWGEGEKVPSLALSKCTGSGRTRPGDGIARGEIARYARYSDYHVVLGDKLRALTEFADQLGGPEARSLWYVDTGPFLERDLAQRAGLGFAGKHTNLISRRLGNWFFISEIVTTLELEPDAPERNHCGSCARCIAACPTQAITAPFELDARRCISYLTIELKGPIPVELRPAIGDRIYGCDDCLAVCPWNRFAKDASLMRPHARPEFSAPDLLELLSLDDAGFKKQFEGTPMLRTKRRGVLRNVCVALGNVGDETTLPALDRARGDKEPLIAEHAAWAIEQIERRL